MKQKNKNKRLTHKLRHRQVQQAMSTKGSDVHRGMGQRSETRVSKGKTTKKKKKLTHAVLGRGQMLGAWGNTAKGARVRRMSDTWKRVSAREKKQCKKKRKK